MPLHQHIAMLGSKPMFEVGVAWPLFNVINAGNYAGNRPAHQKFMILPVGATSSRIAGWCCASATASEMPLHQCIAKLGSKPMDT